MASSDPLSGVRIRVVMLPRRKGEEMEEKMIM